MNCLSTKCQRYFLTFSTLIFQVPFNNAYISIFINCSIPPSSQCCFIRGLFSSMLNNATLQSRSFRIAYTRSSSAFKMHNHAGKLFQELLAFTFAICSKLSDASQADMIGTYIGNNSNIAISESQDHFLKFLHVHIPKQQNQL